MKKIFFFLAVGSLVFKPNYLLSQDDVIENIEGEKVDTTTELSDGPQVLPVDTPPAPQTEVIQTPATTTEPPTSPATSNANDLNIEDPTLEPIEDKKVESPLQKKTGVIPEEELLKPKKKVEVKVKAQKTSETEMYVQEADKYKLQDTFKNLQLNDVIEQGLRKNYEQNIRAQKQELNEIEFSGIKNAFWLPELKITLTTDNQKLSTIRNSSRLPTSPNSTSPNGTLGLSLGDYTVFNWGKDYALYLNKKTNYERNTQIFSESKRELKLDLISNYFTLVASKSVEKIRQDQLRQASFVYRLSKEKVTVGKTSKQDYYQARSEYLRAQNEYHQAKIEADENDEQMAYLITDEVGTKYVINEALEFRRLKMTLEDALALAQKNNPSLLTSKVSIDNAERSYDVALKENMPLPKFSINLGAYNKRFGGTSNTTQYETYSNSGNIELIASIDATWSLTGADGLLNSNKLATSRIAKEIAMKEFEKNNHNTMSLIRQTYKTILSLQNQIVILEARLPSLQKTLDTILENYLGGRTKFYDFSLALQELSTTKIFYEQIKLQHLKEKLLLAKLSGIEDFPGENFEQLAQRVRGK